MKIRRPIGPSARDPPGKKDEYVLKDSEHRIVSYTIPRPPRRMTQGDTP